ncbi:hypothetical protein BS47DRAFT_1292926 [Hydnum rufescens UP504]|uniref:Copper-fist domain-containing protein n=1 Tax=Hydnum rufescens UP504 TaxID=1448309 RepID=A0A9P6B385_9AGAM|nr:hypothetical protein BS47DRAFT_1292926 [Hydnum rufescens UP504]
MVGGFRCLSQGFTHSPSQVLIDSVKYACATCIKGHRSSSCTHESRPLFEIKKKGRPVTQCVHCRELRKTKQVHVKCLCEVKPEQSTVTPILLGRISLS